MDRSHLPAAAFVAPDGSNRAAVEDLTHRIVELAANWASTAGARSPLPDDGSLPDSPVIPETARPVDDILAELGSLVDGSMNAAHPGYIGHMDSIPATISVLGELLSAELNNNMLSLEMSPLLSRLELAVVDAFARQFGFGPGAGGVLTSGGSLANLQALAVARNRALGDAAWAALDRNRRPAIFASAQAHASIRKAAMILGVGAEAVIPVAVDADYRMDPAALETAVAEHLAAGGVAMAMVATVGTTITGSIDPLPPIAEIARRHGVWLHVDAAYGGGLAFSKSAAPLIAGIEAADSITFNPQKWLYVAKTCACVLFRDNDTLLQSFRIDAPYMAETNGFVNLGELSLQGTRHAEVLKLWLTLQHIGRQGFDSLIEAGIGHATRLASQLAQRSGVAVACRPQTNLVCFRLVPPGDETEADRLNAELQRALLAEARIFLSLPRLLGRRWLRAVLLNPYTEWADIQRLLDKVDEFRARFIDG
ncbi:MAG: aspartate aminotransferase family protein [Alphaproteobacteria bacterium]|nr:aspartate aminotransferase family protein [Alphaproteobacteria bacterium]